MGSDDIAGLEFMDGSDDFSVFGDEAVAAPIDLCGVAGRKPLFEQFDAMAANEKLSFSGSLQSNNEVRDAVHLRVHPVDEPFCHGGRCLKRLMRHEVQDGNIPCMSDAAEDR